jgi:sugar lactone lactonase YvrE
MTNLSIPTQMSIFSNPFFKTSHHMRTLIIATTFGIMLIQSHFSKAVDFMYVTNTGSNLVSVYDTNGVIQSTIGSSATLNGPTGIVFDVSGNMFVASHYSNSISKFDSSGRYISSISASLNGPEGLAFDLMGNLYAANARGDTISKFDRYGTYLSTISTNLSGPNGLAVDSNGHLYAANTGDNTISKFDSSGNFLATISSNLYGPTGLTFDSTGNLFASQYHGNWISKFDTSDRFQIRLGSSASLSYAKGMAFDSSGNLYAASSNGYLSKFDPSGSQLYRIQSGFSTPNYIAFHDGLTSTVPEPSSWILAGIGIIALGMTANRKPVFITKGTRLIAPILFATCTAQPQL